MSRQEEKGGKERRIRKSGRGAGHFCANILTLYATRSVNTHGHHEQEHTNCINFIILQRARDSGLHQKAVKVITNRGYVGR